MQAAERLPRVDALGVSSAGIYVDNQTRVASLFRKVPEDAFEAHIRNLYIDLAKELGVPLSVANDGDVAALAGAQSPGVRPVLGLALGTSLAAGYVDGAGKIKGWLNELAFAPIASGSSAMLDEEWSGDRGVGSSYLSQDGAIRLAARAGLSLDPELPPAARLRQIQERTERGDPRLEQVFESLGIYLGYALLDYARFYQLEHVLLLGRVTSGPGGALMLDAARRVLAREDARLAGSLHLHLPSEDERRLWQSVAAASLPRVSSGA
jgi:predicted NBD/HSP70 family sugar kinase